MDSVAEAIASVGVARRRLVALAAAVGAARGALAGAVVGGVAGGVAWLASFDAGLWPIAPIAVGVLAGAATALVRGVRSDVAALTLDAAAHTDEAFVSALAARDADPEFRALSADYAVTKCPRTSVARFLPFRAPAVATTAAVAAAILAALVLVPRSAAPESSWPAFGGNDDVVPLVGGRSAPGAPTASPRDRVERLSQAISKDGAGDTASLAAAARKDLGAVTNDDLRRLADALAARSATADAAKRALAALDRGDRAAATDALREALGGGTSVTSGQGTGTGTAPAAASPGSRAPWSAPTWPLRYDRVVRRWLDETSAAEAGARTLHER